MSGSPPHCYSISKKKHEFNRVNTLFFKYKRCIYFIRDRFYFMNFRRIASCSRGERFSQLFSSF